MYRGFSIQVLAERSRNKERLKASLAGLCELELLKQRQECLVLGALSLGDTVHGPDGWQPARYNSDKPSCSKNDNRYQPGLRGSYWGLIAFLERQVDVLRVDTSPAEPPMPSLEDLEMVMGEMRKSKPTEDYYCQAKNVETYILGLIHRSPMPSPLRPSKPRTSLVHDGVTMVRKSSFCCKEGQDQHLLPLSCRAEGLSPWASSSLDQEPYELLPLHEDVLVNHLHQQQLPPPLQPGRYPRTRKPSLINNPHSASLDSPLSCRSTANQDPSSSEPDSPHHHSHQARSSPPLPDQKLVNAQYIPAYPCQAPTRSFARALLHSHRPPGGPKSSQSAFPPERSSIQQQQQLPPPLQMQSKSRGVPKKFRFSEERPAFKKPGKRACRSQSENSLLGQRSVPEHKYNTLEKDGGTPAAASQLESGISRRNRKARSGPPKCAYAVSHPPLHMEHMERERAPLGRPADCCTLPDHRESESSISEVDSPASSSLSSDSDESSGFVWPQQLHLHLALPSPAGPSEASLQPKAFVKIKASHALKKKILRFHTGSLKVMTTV
ncbi:dapper homolog 3 [Osmerus mordax]|uniref:dapper homolog 3 n=1 Tax=Osmerus mordax TaxID=8014 RepID=UPI00350F648F